MGDVAPLTAVAISGLPVAYRSDSPAVCTVNGSTAVLLAAGECRITAAQEGNEKYLPAPEVSVSFTVTEGNEPGQQRNYLPAVLK